MNNTTYCIQTRPKCRLVMYYSFQPKQEPMSTDRYIENSRTKGAFNNYVGNNRGKGSVAHVNMKEKVG